MKPLLIGIVGSKNTGKTNFTLECSQLLGEIGISVLVIKFSSSHYSIEPEGKDSTLFRDAGVKTVIFSSPYETVIHQKVANRSSLEELLKLVPDEIQIVLCESYPANYPKIPFILVTRSIIDYEETKHRYSHQKPIIVIKSPSIKNGEKYKEINTLSINDLEDRKEIRFILLGLLNKSSA